MHHAVCASSPGRDGPKGNGSAVRSALRQAASLPDANGEVLWLAMPVAPVRISAATPGNEPTSMCSGGSGGVVSDGPWLVLLDFHVDVPPTGGPIVIDVGPVPTIVRTSVTVQMPDGTPVWNATVDITGEGEGFPDTNLTHFVGNLDGDFVWFACPRSACPAVTTRVGGSAATNERPRETDANGVVHQWQFEPPIPGWPFFPLHVPCYTIHYDDGERSQITTADCSAEPVVAELPYMPVVRIITPPVDAVLPGSAVQMTVRAVDGSGEPLAGQVVSIAPVGGATATASGPSIGPTPSMASQTVDVGHSEPHWV